MDLFFGLALAVSGSALTAWLAARWIRMSALRAERQRRSWVQATLRAIAEGVIATDARGRVEFLNPAAAELTGWTEVEALGRPIGEVFRLHSSSESGKEAASGLRAGRIGSSNGVANRTVLVRRDGTDVPITATTAPIRDDGVGVAGIVTVFRDATKRVRAEETVRANEARFRGLVEDSSDIVWEVDDAGAYTYCSPNVKNVLGWDPSELVGRKPFDLMPDQEVARVSAEIVPHINRRDSFALVTHGVKRKDGGVGVLECSGRPVFGEDGRFRGYRGIDRDVTQRNRIEKALQESEERFRQLAENIREVFWLIDAETGRAIYTSPAYETIWGRARSELEADPRAWLEAVHPDDRTRLEGEIQKDPRHSDYDEEYRVVRPDGSVRWVRDRAFPILDAQGRVYRVAGIAEDVTERKQAEESLRRSEDQLRQSQKMEAVGRMAGGVAHDFNNMLTAITGYSELALRRLELKDPVRRDVEEIRKAAERSAALTRQLLAFSRRQVLNFRCLNLNDVTADLDGLLRRTLGDDVEIVTRLGSPLGRVRIDPVQIQLAVMNLATNARDAMPKGGRLTIATADVVVEEARELGYCDVPRGRFTVLSVGDSGAGMTEEAKAHLFEPFFTTKPRGKGTGLGLSTVYGIVKQSNGHIEIESGPGKGTTVRMYFPVMEEGKPEATTRTRSRTPRGTETILVVEDEDVVRNLVREQLRSWGYNVLDARNGVEAVALVRREPEEIHLLLTDVVMPGMGGRDLAREMAGLRPKTRILFMSGYTADQFAEGGADAPALIQKPFTSEALARRVREVLDTKS